MIKFVNAKINIGLYITRKRSDGYHELETLFYPVGKYNGTPENSEPFCDILEIVPLPRNEEDKLELKGRIINCKPEENLVYRALKMFKMSLNKKDIYSPSFKIILFKNIPDGAGLGGGSADASFTLTGLNELCGNPLAKGELLDLATSLGADCPFFIENRPVIASGIGEIMKPTALDLSGYWCIIMKPDIYISTKDAFGGIAPKVTHTSIEYVTSLPVEEWNANGLSNDFESHIFELYPKLSELRNLLLKEGALYASMSGSGSSIYGIFPNRTTAEHAFFKLKNKIDNTVSRFIIKL